FAPDQSLLLPAIAEDCSDVLVDSPGVLSIRSMVFRVGLEGAAAELTAILPQVDRYVFTVNIQERTKRARSISTQRPCSIDQLADGQWSTASSNRAQWNSRSIERRNGI